MTTKTPSWVKFASLMITVGLSVTACAGSSDSDNGDKIKGAHSGKSSKGASTPDAAGRPKIHLPKSRKNIFDNEDSSDPVKKRILADNAQSLNAIDDAIIRGKDYPKEVSFYHAGAAEKDTKDFIKSRIDNDTTVGGKVRYFDREVTVKGKSALLTYCIDESHGTRKSRKTGKILTPPRGWKPYARYTLRAAKSEEGVWRTVDVRSESGVAECKP